jgi:hypothetical protein
LDGDRQWLATLSDRFGRLPSVQHLAVLILVYLLVVGPANVFLLKRREARVWLIGTVPVLAAVFGGFVLILGYWSHGLRAATNYLALGVVTPEGDRAFVEEFVAVYGTTSAEYRIDYPRNLPVRPLGEYVASPNGGIDSPSSFALEAVGDRQVLQDWRLTFWQTRATASQDCIPLDGLLTAQRRQQEIVVTNGTDIAFDCVMLMSGSDQNLGPLQPFGTLNVDILGMNLKAVAHSPISWPNDESRAMLDLAKYRLKARGGDWLLGVTRRQPHAVSSPDTSRIFVSTIYAWPVTMSDAQVGAGDVTH